MSTYTKEKCPVCDGTGEVHSHNSRCFGCGGRGSVLRTLAGVGPVATAVKENMIRLSAGLEMFSKTEFDPMAQNKLDEGFGALVANEVIAAELREALWKHEFDSEERLLNRGWRLYRKDVTRTPEADLPPVVRAKPTSKTRRTLALIDALLESKGYVRD